MFLVYFIVGLIAGVIGANMAKKRDQNPALWFVICFLVPIALLGLFFIEKKVTEEEFENISGESFKDNTYSIELKKTDDVNFETIKNKANEFYKEYGFESIKIDKDNSYMVKTDDGKSYFHIEDIYEDTLKFSVFNSKKPTFIDSLYPIESANDEEIQLKSNDSDKTAKLIDLANMYEKGLLSKEEFEKMKQELV
jgi:hypothetical protein